MNVHETVYSVSTTCNALSNEALVTEGAGRSDCVSRELAKRLAFAIDALGSLYTYSQALTENAQREREVAYKRAAGILVGSPVNAYRQGI